MFATLESRESITGASAETTINSAAVVAQTLQPNLSTYFDAIVPAIAASLSNSTVILGRGFVVTPMRITTMIFTVFYLLGWRRRIRTRSGYNDAGCQCENACDGGK